MTVKLLRDIHPDYLVFCFDRKEASFRVDLYPEYKANRDEMPELLQPQVPYVKKLTELLGIPMLDKEGYEADDVIGVLTNYGRKAGLEVVIVSGDKDFAQLIGPHVSMYDTMKDHRYDPDGVMEKWGIHPEQMIDYLALVGDSSDNIPGVRGIGPKGAQKLLSEFRSLDGIYANIDKITAKAMKQKLIEHKEMAYLSQKLVTIVQELDLGIQLDDLKMRAVNKEGLREILQELGFKTFIRNLVDGESGPLTSNNSVGPKKVSAKSETAKESKNSNYQKSELKEVQWQIEDFRKEIEPYSVLWAHLNERGLFFSYKDYAISSAADPVELGQVLSQKHLLWRGFDLKEVWKVLKPQQVSADWDQMLAAYVVRAGLIESFLEVYAEYTGKAVPDFASAAQIFNCHFELEDILRRRLKETEGNSVLKQFELPLVSVLYAMEGHGIGLNIDELKEQSKELEQDIADLEKTIHAEANEQFNIASPKQMAVVLFEHMKLPTGKKTKTGFSTNNDVLEKLRDKHAIIPMIIEYRELSKLKSTYVEALPSLIDKEDGRIHTHLRQAATATGRLSSVHPNLQNIPIRTPRGRLVRKAFVSDKGKVFISADYSQIELRILAHITEDPGLRKAFEQDVDIHTATASEIFGVRLDQVDSELRRKAKAVNFGIAYGQGVFGLSESLQIGRAEASEIIERYFERFKGVKNYMESIVRTAMEQGYVESVFGRRRYIDELKSKNQNIRKFGERAAINAPIQGTASDLVKLAMIKLYEEIELPMLLQVHDELLFECPEDEVEEHCPRIKEVMENITKLSVPLKVNLATGKNWEDAHS